MGSSASSEFCWLEPRPSECSLASASLSASPSHIAAAIGAFSLGAFGGFHTSCHSSPPSMSARAFADTNCGSMRPIGLGLSSSSKKRQYQTRSLDTLAIALHSGRKEHFACQAE